MKRPRTTDEGVGHDSFLDITANLVGILIILVVVVGAKTRVDAEKIARRNAEQQLQEDLTEPRAEAIALLESLQQQRDTERQYEFEVAYRREERNALLARVIEARESLEEALEQADEKKRARVAAQQEIDELKSKLAEVEEQLGTDEEHPRPKITLEHLPTPMAQTVFTREVHLQLKQNRLTAIPWDRLVDTLKTQVPLAISRHRSGGDIEETLGPIGGFMMHYRLVRVPEGHELERFELEPLPNAPSETLDQALSPGGRVLAELASRDSDETVVTVWVYPDSFETFRQLKARLFEKGYLSAARPLPEGVRIGASPHGSRSAAQ